MSSCPPSPLPPTELPISQLPDTDPDPEIEKGLYAIRALDAQLDEKTLEAVIVARETFPERWAAEERRRMDRHVRAVEEALK